MKKKIVSFFLSKINTDKFSEIIKKSAILSIPYKIIAKYLIDPNFPYHLFIETTSACNLKCKMCARNWNAVKIGSMNLDLFKKIIDEAFLYGPRTFSLHISGEPLICPDILTMISYIKEKNKKNTILLTTNGVLLNEKVSMHLISERVDKIFISMHSSNNEDYTQITGVNKLNSVEENVKKLIELKKDKNETQPLIHLRMIVNKKEKEKIKNFQNKWKDFPVRVEIREPHNFGGKINTESPKKTDKRYPCYHLWFSPGINFDGDFSICCCDLFKEGIVSSLSNKSISDIWKGKNILKYREYHLKGEYDKIPLCKNCDVWKTYPDIFFKWQKK